MNRIFCLLIALLPLMAAAQNWKSFSDTSISFTAKYPPDWVSKIKEEKRVFFTSPADGDQDNFRENVNIGVKSHPSYGVTVTVSDILPSVLESLASKINSFQKESERFFTWNNSEEAELIYTGVYEINGNSFTVRITQWFCFWNTKLYTATYTALKNASLHDEEARTLLLSIRFR